MTAPLMDNVTDVFVDKGYAVLRFNFRGVGTSTGTWGNGVDEIDDVAAAVAAAKITYPELQLGITGWSFGAATSLRWAAREHSSLPWVGIAPPPPIYSGKRRLPLPDELISSPRTIIIGDRDQYASVQEMSNYAAEVGASIQVLKGSDHFFYFREAVVGQLTVDGLSPAAASADTGVAESPEVAELP